MRQVPTYLLIGDGRVSCHFQHYFKYLGLYFEVWRRADGIELLSAKLMQATHVLLLVNDGAIEEFIKTTLDPAVFAAGRRTHAAGRQAVVPAKAGIQPIIIHFSGSLTTDHAHGAHPLMTFSHDLYEESKYCNIPFIIDDAAPEFSQLLPGLPNPHWRLNKKLKAKYHALCVLSGNFSCLLWNKLFNDFENELNLPASVAHPYLQQQMQNLMQNPKQALTGPLVRGDQATIAKNIDALAGDEFQEVYQSFVKNYQTEPRA